MNYYKSGKACVCVTVIFIKETTVKRMFYVFLAQSFAHSSQFSPFRTQSFHQREKSKEIQNQLCGNDALQLFQFLLFQLSFIYSLVHSFKKQQKKFHSSFNNTACLGFTKTIKNVCLCIFSILYISMKQSRIYTGMLAVSIFPITP